MNRLAKTMWGSLAGIFCIGAISASLTLSVEYKPYGVPDHLREQYDNTIAKLERRAAIAHSTTQQPHAHLPEHIHDFGMLDPHQTATYSFEIRNLGNAPLELAVTETSCKCTVGTLHKRFVPAGDHTKVTLTWNTGYQADHYEQTATITTNDPKQEIISLTVKGNVRGRFVAPDSISFRKTDPGKNAEASFVVFSQLWNDFVVTDIESELEGFEWNAEPLSVNDSVLADREAKSAWKIRVWTYRQDARDYSGEISLTARPVTAVPSGEVDPIVTTLTAAGTVRASINFYSPDIHKHEGLDIGTVVSGKERHFNLVVRARSIEPREIKVLDVKPQQLKTSLRPLLQRGSYRLSIEVPEDCPMVVFNGDHKHGYVQVGDPNDPSFSNWFPLRGAVVELSP